MNPTANDNNAAAIIAVAREAEASKRPEIRNHNGLDILVAHTGAVTALEKLAATPRRKRASVQLVEPASFISYLNLHKEDLRTHIFGLATEADAGFRAVIDYHSAGVAAAAWGDHVATLKLETTPEWRRWVANNEKLMPQEAFAEFIEANLTDIVAPFSGDILDMAQGLKGHKTAHFKSGKNLKNGAIALEYSESVEISGTTNRRSDTFTVPDTFTLGLVPFIGGDGIEITARLRYRIGDDGKLSFAYLLNRPYLVIQQAFIATRERIEKEVSLPVHVGTAEIKAPNY